MIDLKKWKYKNYGFQQIEEESKKEGHSLTEHNPKYAPNGLIGESFLVLNDDRNHTLSFVLDGTTEIEYIYKLIWKG